MTIKWVITNYSHRLLDFKPMVLSTIILYPNFEIIIFFESSFMPMNGSILTILTFVRWNFKVIWFTFPWRLKVLNISLSVSQRFEFSLFRIICLCLHPKFLTGLFVIKMSSFLLYLYIFYISHLSRCSWK